MGMPLEPTESEIQPGDYALCPHCRQPSIVTEDYELRSLETAAEVWAWLRRISEIPEVAERAERRHRARRRARYLLDSLKGSHHRLAERLQDAMARAINAAPVDPKDLN